jgi:hypothetical protein
MFDPLAEISRLRKAMQEAHDNGSVPEMREILEKALRENSEKAIYPLDGYW